MKNQEEPMAIVKRRDIRFVGVHGAKNVSAVELVGEGRAFG